jgi:hypothetical protein
MVSKKKRKGPPQMPNTKSKFEILPDGQHMHKVVTPYGTIVYTYKPEIMRSILSGIFTTMLGRAHFNKPLNFQRLFETLEDEPPYEYLFTRDPELLAEKELHSEHAANLLLNQASPLLIEASEQLIQEIIFRTLRELQEQGQYKLNSKISELLKSLTSDIIERVKIRVNAPTQGGSTPIWTPERKEAFLVVYEDAFKTLKDAKDIYKRNKRRKWKALILAEHPQLPDHFIDQLTTGKDAQPNVIAYAYAAEIFNVACSDYLSKVVADARRRRKENRTIKKDI